MPDEPVTGIPQDDAASGPQPGTALCLSGGGFRAMVFHAGVLWRLYEANLLKSVDRISTVSGGSIAAAVLALAWPRLSFNPVNVRSDFVPLVVDPIRGMAGESIDTESVFLGALLPGTIADRLTNAFDIQLFHGATLQDLPDDPLFVINATNVQSGVLCRFMKYAIRDYRVGEFRKPTLSLARAVAASSAFPPMLSPCEIRFAPGAVTPGSGLDLEREPFTTEMFLTDGGVYDNLGLETAWKRYQTVLVSDAGAKLVPEGEPPSDWLHHTHRVLSVIDNQVRSLRKRQVIESFKSGARTGAYWGIGTNIADYRLANALPCPFAQTLTLAEIPTRLQRLTSARQEQLINWGYAVCDAALRAHVTPAPAPPTGFPYPNAGV